MEKKLYSYVDWKDDVLFKKILFFNLNLKRKKNCIVSGIILENS